jgi:hypothetical protein
MMTSPNNYQGDSYSKANQNGDDSIEVIHYSQVSS